MPGARQRTVRTIGRWTLRLLPSASMALCLLLAGPASASGSTLPQDVPAPPLARRGHVHIHHHFGSTYSHTGGGGVIGVLVLLLIIGIVVFVVIRLRRRRR